jgi:TonB family protein
VSDDVVPFSFFNTIFLSRRIENEGLLKEIVRHEAVHIREGHSYDIVLLQALKAFFWFNPFLYLVDRLLREAHEFQADAHVLGEGLDVNVYESLLLRHLGGTQWFVLSNQFNYSIIKRRLFMISHKSTRWSGLKPILVVPVVSGLLFFSASGSGTHDSVTGMAESLKEVLAIVSPISDPETVAATGTEAPPETKEPPEQNAESTSVLPERALPLGLPEFPGGEKAMDLFIRDHLKHPAVGKFANTGQVELSFTVEPDGSLSNIRVIRPLSPECDAEAIRVVNSMPRWRPGVHDGKPVRVHQAITVAFNAGSADVSKRRVRWTGKATVPEFPGGKEKLNEFLEKNQNYRYAGANNRAEVTVRVGFLVDTDGSLCEIFLAGYGSRSAMAAKFMPVFFAEAFRVVSSMPQWVSAKNEAGDLVCVRQTVELAFTTAGLAVTPQRLSSTSQATGKDDSGEVFLADEVDVRPVFPGGAGKLQEYLDENLPNPAIEEFFAESGFGIRSASVGYIVETDGTITNVVLRNSSGNPAFDEALIQFYTTKMPKWIPATSQGNHVRVFMPGYSSSFATRPVLDEGIWVRDLIHPHGTTKALNRVENMPVFPGGYHALKQFFSTHVNYPLDSQKKGLQGVVTLSYLIGTDGTVSEIEVIRSLDPACDAEAVRVATSLPRWKPAAFEGTPFPVRLGMSVPFTLPKQTLTGTSQALFVSEPQIAEGKYTASSHGEYLEFLPGNRVSFRLSSRTGIYVTYQGTGHYLLRDGHIIIQPDRPAWLPDSVVQRLPKTVSPDSVRIQVLDKQGGLSQVDVWVTDARSESLSSTISALVMGARPETISRATTDSNGNAVLLIPKGGQGFGVQSLAYLGVRIDAASLSEFDYRVWLEKTPTFSNTMEYLQSLTGGLEYKFMPGTFSIRRKIGFSDGSRSTYGYQWVDYGAE